MNKIRIAPIVEGHGEVESVAILIKRIVAAEHPLLQVDVLHPIRMPASKLKKMGELERAVELAARNLRAKGGGGILILLDCDDGCPAKDGPVLLQRATRVDVPVSVVLAKKEFETWFIAAAESLRGHRDLPNSLNSTANPESIRDAKGWLSRQMQSHTSYSETLDQPALTAAFDLSLAKKRSASFDKCFREIRNLSALIQAH